jgi:hypothetical protein
MQVLREQLMEAADMAGLDPDEAIHEDYSGRGMFGRTCPALTADSHSEVYAFMAALGALLGAGTPEDHNADTDALDIATSTRTDQFGRGVVAYWPDLTII